MFSTQVLSRKLNVQECPEGLLRSDATGAK